MLSFAVDYHKRFRMERELSGLPERLTPAGYTFLAWQVHWLEAHAEVLAACFAGATDAQIFPTLGSREGCLQLMTEVVRRRDFLPEATWLLVGPNGPCGSIQALRERTGLVAIQNIGIRPEEQNRGLGRALLLHLLHALQQAGHARVQLEVTVSNTPALRLYQSLGFRRSKVVYKPVRCPATNSPTTNGVLITG
ncbi:MAG: GNAT family N-acetyltransferase [Gemmataceae bacterium]